MSDKQVIHTLNRLHRICVAGERGFNAVAENVSNRGLKVLLKMYAQQRHRFAAELQVEIKRLGGNVVEGRNLLGMIHRGRIDIFATSHCVNIEWDTSDSEFKVESEGEEEYHDTKTSR